MRNKIALLQHAKLGSAILDDGNIQDTDNRHARRSRTAREKGIKCFDVEALLEEEEAAEEEAAEEEKPVCGYGHETTWVERVTRTAKDAQMPKAKCRGDQGDGVGETRSKENKKMEARISSASDSMSKRTTPSSVDRKRWEREGGRVEYNGLVLGPLALGSAQKQKQKQKQKREKTEEGGAKYLEQVPRAST
ncbi:hypothetical protein GQX73_g1003 [Xylaria multiplex]|uniref:Uncharacterized protein n=1 Tax=Xylaria multiplex TaxID=323545 RepID=A0A7C8J7M5_9PEZI|nr:hypothetical protein GQX73_g1003 [Xylaria multiplex]